MFYLFVILSLCVFLYFQIRTGDKIGEISIGKVVDFEYGYYFLSKRIVIKTELTKEDGTVEYYSVYCSSMSYISRGDEIVYERYKYKGLARNISNDKQKRFGQGVDCINNIQSISAFLEYQKNL